MWACEFCTYLNVGVAAESPRCDCCGKIRDGARQKLTAVARSGSLPARSGGGAAAPPRAVRPQPAAGRGELAVISVSSQETWSQVGSRAVAARPRDAERSKQQQGPRAGKKRRGEEDESSSSASSDSSSSSSSTDDSDSSDDVALIEHSRGKKRKQPATLTTSKRAVKRPRLAAAVLLSASSSSSSQSSDTEVRDDESSSSSSSSSGSSTASASSSAASSSDSSDSEFKVAPKQVAHRKAGAGSDKATKASPRKPSAGALASHGRPPTAVLLLSSSEEDTRPASTTNNSKKAPKARVTPALSAAQGGSKPSKRTTSSMASLALAMERAPPLRKAPPPPPLPLPKAKGQAAVTQAASPVAEAGQPWYLSSAPASTSDLLRALHKDRVVTTEALLSAMVGSGSLDAAATPPPKLLILLGPPGTGKSSLVRCLATMHGWTLREAAEHSALRAPPAPAPGDVARGRDGGDGEDGSRFSRSGGSSGPSMSTAAFCSFLLGATSYKALQLVAPARSGSDSGTQRSAVAPPALLARPPPLPAPVSVDASPGAPALLLLEELPRVDAGEGGASWIRESDPDVTALRQAFASFLEHGRTPAVLVVSEGPGAGEAPTKPALARLLGPALLDHHCVSLLTFPPVPDTRMRKTLLAVAQAHGVRHASAPSASSSGGYVVPFPVPDLISGIVATARGDLRHALVSLEFACTRPELMLAKGVGGGGGELPLDRRPRDVHADAGDRHVWGPSASASSSSGSSALLCGRDDFFDSIHVLGKLIYAKRDAALLVAGAASASAPAPASGDDPRGALQYDPDSLMATAAYDAGTVAAFILENGAAAFTEVGQLAQAWEALSLADTLLARGGGGGGLAPRPRARLTRYPTAIAGGSLYAAGTGLSTETSAGSVISRVVSTHNTSPAPSSFRALRRPVAFAVARLATSNWRWVAEAGLGAGPELQYAQTATGPALSTGSASAPPPLSALSPSERAVEVIPTLGLMLRSGGRGPPLSRRASALIAAACTFGTGDAATVDGAGWVTSLLGAPAAKHWGEVARGGRPAYTAARGNDADAAAAGSLLDAADLVGAGSESSGSDGEEGGPSASGPRSRGAAASSALAGMVVGAWEARAAKTGVDVTAAEAALVPALAPPGGQRSGGSGGRPPLPQQQQAGAPDLELRIEDPDAPRAAAAFRPHSSR